MGSVSVTQTLHCRLSKEDKHENIHVLHVNTTLSVSSELVHHLKQWIETGWEWTDHRWWVLYISQHHSDTGVLPDLTSFSWYCNAAHPPAWCGHGLRWRGRCPHCRHCWRRRPAPSWARGWGAGGWCASLPNDRGSTTNGEKKLLETSLHLPMAF